MTAATYAESADTYREPMPEHPTSKRSNAVSATQAGAALVLLAAALGSTPAVAAPAPQPLHRADLTVTEGTVASVPTQAVPAGFHGPVLVTRSPGMRAVHRDGGRHARRATLRFRLRGPSDTIKPLGSGEIRRQIGLKLRAKDPCNLVYAMWRDQDHPAIVVSVKRNPGQHTSAECGNRGYTDVATIPAPTGRVGATHVLDARTRRTADGSLALSVFADGARVSRLRISAALTAGIEGGIGVRSDNGNYLFSLSAGGAAG